MSTQYIDAYNNLTPPQKMVVDIATLSFSGIYEYSLSTLIGELQLPINTNKLMPAVKEMMKQKMLETSMYYLTTPIDLRVWLYPRLMAVPENVILARKIWESRHTNSWNKPLTYSLASYLHHTFMGTKADMDSIIYGISNSSISFVPFISKMITDQAYDQALMASPLVFKKLWDDLFFETELFAESFSPIKAFLEKAPEASFPAHAKASYYSKMAFWEGDHNKNNQLIEKQYNTLALINTSHLALYSGQYELSLKSFETARVVDHQGLKTKKADFNFLDELLYWINYLLYPEGMDGKKAEIFIKKAIKDQNNNYGAVLPFMYMARKEIKEAERELNLARITQWEENGAENLFTVFRLMALYVVYGQWTDKQARLASRTAMKLKENGHWLMLNELVDIFGLTGRNVPSELSLPNGLQLPTSLSSRFGHQEKWDLTLDALLALTNSGVQSPKAKNESTSRVAYSISMKHYTIQPILQTYNSKGWSAGRNIALSKFYNQNVEGMTPQDSEVAKSMKLSSSYYGSKELWFDFTTAIDLLCGHPYLFLAESPNVSLELVRAQPELVTEESAKGIKLATNLPDGETDFHVIKETQTRYKVIKLNAAQKKAVAMINKGILIPKKGKEKLMRAVEGLSGIITVQSNLADAPVAAKSIEADSRLRIQIIPFGNGLKAEVFVKPLGSTPPYLKPGKGAKGVLGEKEGEKVHTLRDLKTENDRLSLLSEDMAEHIDMEGDRWEEPLLFDDPHQCLDLLETLNRHADIAVAEWPDGEQFKLRRTATSADLRLHVGQAGQWFEIEGELALDSGTVLSIKELLEMTRKGKGRFLELGRNEFLALTAELRKQLLELDAMAVNENGKVKLHPLAAHGLDDLTNGLGSFKADKHWKDLKKKIATADKAVYTVPATLDAELRPYQEEGFRWLCRLHGWGAGACLADDMGLGKTLQAIAMMLHLADNGPMLVVCPASVVPNWCAELSKFAPTLNPIVLRNNNREETFGALAPRDVLVVTYGLLHTENERIANQHWAMAVLDEAHAIKNALTKSSKAAMHLQADFRLVLTGTPIQNHLGELWNLFQFCNPGLLGNQTAFGQRFVKTDDPNAKPRLKKLIAPFILRRTKNSVLDELPPKTEITQSIELSDQEMAFYEALRLEAIENLEQDQAAAGTKHLQALAEITKLRLACCNASLVNKNLKLPSSKLDAFLEIVDELRENKHRALVFSQFVGHLAIVRQALDKLNIDYQYLDGSTPIADRQTAVKNFQSGKSELFLISLKAGGLGLNLTAADYVIHLDPWWNPAIEDQASDRAHRMGQTRPVTIYRLVAKNTIEEKIVRLHATKRDLADTLLEGTDQSSQLSTADLLELLKER
jgi:superfamily II DNA or RNA helicase